MSLSDLQLQQQRKPTAKLPRLLLNAKQHQPPFPSASLHLPLFVPQLQLTTSKLTDMSAFPPDSTPTPTRLFPSKMGSYFSLTQWQELELQALIFRHMLAGSAVPPELLHSLKKSLHTSPPPSFRPFQHFSPYPPPWYWGRAAMDSEPGRCRRTDGKKWRCSRDVVAGQKYCERHVHRGRNRSRKPVEIPTPPSSSSVGSGSGGGSLKTDTALLASQPPTGITGGTPTQFTLSGSAPSTHLPHTQRCGEVPGDGNSGSRVLRHFFDDWPRTLQQPDSARSSSSAVTSSADFLKLSTGGDGDGSGPGHPEDNSARERVQLNWGEGWAPNPVAPMGGPLGEALRSSTTSNSSPTRVLHRLPRSSASETI